MEIIVEVCVTTYFDHCESCPLLELQCVSCDSGQVMSLDKTRCVGNSCFVLLSLLYIKKAEKRQLEL